MSSKVIIIDDEPLARSIVDVLRDPLERDRLAAVGLEVAARYDWQAVGASYRSLYDEIAP